MGRSAPDAGAAALLKASSTMNTSYIRRKPFSGLDPIRPGRWTVGQKKTVQKPAVTSNSVVEEIFGLRPKIPQVPQGDWQIKSTGFPV